MKKDFKQELTELINKHGLEKEIRDTPDFILAQVCIDAMAVFSEAIARRDEWHEFRRQTKGVRRMQNTITRMIAMKRKFRKKPRKEQGNETR